jgi:hypothetical protein
MRLTTTKICCPNPQFGVIFSYQSWDESVTNRRIIGRFGRSVSDILLRAILSNGDDDKRIAATMATSALQWCRNIIYDILNLSYCPFH